MALSNAPVDPQRLPALEAQSLQPVSPRFAPYQLISRFLSLLPLAFLAWLLPVMTGMPLAMRPVLLAGVGLLLVVSPVLAWLEARRRAWAVREQDVTYQSGLLVQRTTVLPFVRIQHVETASNPVERAFGLVRLTCFTAGGAGGDLVIQGLERDRAERLRQYLLDRIQGAAAPPANGETGEADGR
ncbi:PH domain-containing protein [Alkalilimnicola ehrlichii MLHE-1]|uniref:Membrane-flanked domain protein n=1 Tax=Alkalilimnicola ehrlichii (strain ATCC BAA-1101 / DSM 17681 / MLHE-1) TaxID=187272 RepID=Q0A9I8_ALKEH|nr:PH domain-containing protein [Alkalilimnicola ehrlichii]ABI56499.1 membrane-flanked domain protein [Alkalilimnicola ehrlichii MLHE-1]